MQQTKEYMVWLGQICETNIEKDHNVGAIVSMKTVQMVHIFRQVFEGEADKAIFK